MSLFREEVLARKTESLHGTINLAVPMSWQMISACLTVVLLVAAAFLFSASYSRSETASGSVLPNGGILQVIPPRSGQVQDLRVREGQLVRRGSTLATVRAEQTDRLGAGTQTSIISAIDLQQRGIDEQQALMTAAGSSEQAEYDVQVSGLRQEVQSIETQIAVQQRLVDMARATFLQASKIAERGFISQRDLAVREETLLSRQQQLFVLQQTRSAKVSSIEQTRRAQRQAAATRSGNAAALAASRAQVERERATARGEQEFSLLAPANGRVAAVNIHVGDSVNAQDPVMMLVPAGSVLVARLLVSAKAAGFVRSGQSVLLSMDAFPQDRFGAVKAVISSVSSAPILQRGKDGGSEPFYVASARMTDPFVRAYGREERLRPGMTFTARIITERRSLIEWLFDPLFAAASQ